jgi:hypothetical protein
MKANKKPSKKVFVTLNRETVEEMIGTYECLKHNCSSSEDKRGCTKIINALKKSLKIDYDATEIWDV